VTLTADGGKREERRKGMHAHVQYLSLGVDRVACPYRAQR
jgi:hypothetical protein